MITTWEALYGKENELQRKRYEELKRGFSDTFQGTENLEYFSAPGRAEIGGNHTDHNHGRVLTAAVDLDVAAAARKTEGSRVSLKSAEYPGMDEIDLSDLSARKEEQGTSAALLRGICFKCRELGFQVGPFQCYTMTRVLKGSGLSSSAAFEVLIVTVISHLYNDGKIDPVTAAIISQYAENAYFGKPSGLLDQMASSVGGFTSIDFKDPRNPVIEKLSFDFASCGHALCVVDTGGNHANLTNEYAAIPEEMRKVAAFFGKEFLREVDEEEFYGNLEALRRSAGDRAVLRAMHFFDDDRLALEEAEALKAGDFESFKRKILSSGRSSFMKLQNVFAVTAPEEQGISVALAMTEKLLDAAGAWRVHGGGFAGTIQAFVPDEKLEGYREGMEKVFGKGSCYVLSVREAGGTKVRL